MGKENIKLDKIHHFSLGINTKSKELKTGQIFFTWLKALIRIAIFSRANVEAYKEHFIHKMSISFGEAQESKYWLWVKGNTGSIQEKAIADLIF